LKLEFLPLHILKNSKCVNKYELKSPSTHLLLVNSCSLPNQSAIITLVYSSRSEQPVASQNLKKIFKNLLHSTYPGVLWIR
jgi:hypothetical protein